MALLKTPHYPISMPQVFRCRYVNSLRPTDRPIRIMERSVYSGYACFLATAEERGEISGVEHALAKKWFEFMDSQVGEMIKPDLGRVQQSLFPLKSQYMSFDVVICCNYVECKKSYQIEF